jgi:hypothetical protein
MRPVAVVMIREDCEGPLELLLVQDQQPVQIDAPFTVPPARPLPGRTPIMSAYRA